MPALALLRLVPVWIWLAAAVLGYTAWQKHRADAAQARLATAAAQLRAEAETNRRAAALQEIADAQVIRARELGAARRRADAAGNGLRVSAAAFAASAPAAGECAATADRAGVLADLLGRVEEAGRRMAAVADERGAALDACVSSYDALRRP